MWTWQSWLSGQTQRRSEMQWFWRGGRGEAVFYSVFTPVVLQPWSCVISVALEAGLAQPVTLANKRAGNLSPQPWPPKHTTCQWGGITSSFRSLLTLFKSKNETSCLMECLHMRGRSWGMKDHHELHNSLSFQDWEAQLVFLTHSPSYFTAPFLGPTSRNRELKKLCL